MSARRVRGLTQFFGSGVSALVAALLVAALIAAPARAAFPGSNGKIAYHTSGSGIYRINPDGSNLELVKSGNVYNAVWSSDGTKIAYLDSGTQIRITTADGTGSTLVCTCIQTGSWMSWSADGTKFAFHKGVAGVNQVFVVNSDGTGETQLTNGAGYSAFPAWSPDGTKIAFVRSGGGVWVMNADGTGQVALSSSTGDDRPSWSPDGTKLAFVNLGDLWTMNANGTNQVKITTHGGSSDSNPAWSPDGHQIAFRGGGDLEVVNVDGTGRTALGALSARQPNWQPITPSYPRPKGATPVSASLVPAMWFCGAVNRAHGPPLAFGSCSPPQRRSSYLTVGTPDANGQPAASSGSLRAEVLVGAPGPTDEADVRFTLSLTDVRLAADLTDYAGELSAQFTVRRTDKESQPFGTTPGTMLDRTFSFDATCAPTAGPEGASCAAQTTADALLPGTVQEGRRAIWELGQVQVFDGGPDGDTSTDDNTLFEVSGVFIP
jgi:dipeptidyl aminopeptidase/acylaminoacyl peptidase